MSYCRQKKTRQCCLVVAIAPHRDSQVVQVCRSTYESNKDHAALIDEIADVPDVTVWLVELPNVVFVNAKLLCKASGLKGTVGIIG